MKLLKEIIEFACATVYAIFLPVIQKEPRRLVICYHSVRKQNVERFKKQMAYLAKKCHVAKVSEIRFVSANAKKVVAGITFDDAYTSVIENAVPILKEHGLPAAVFVPTGNLGQPSNWEMPNTYPDTNERVMNEEQVAELSKNGFEVFSHTVSHPFLTEIDEDTLKSELLESKRELERIIGGEVPAIGYPHGAHDARVCNAARRTGYKLGFTIEPRMVDSSPDNMKIGRFEVSSRDSLIKFRLKVSGAYQAVNYLRTLKKLFLSSPQ